MRRIRDLAAAIWEFVAGDDWVTAAGVVAGLGLTALVSGTSSAWIVRNSPCCVTRPVRMVRALSATPIVEGSDCRSL